MPHSLKSNISDKHDLFAALDKLIQWIVKSFVHNNGLGSSIYQTYFGYWSEPYPETTAYLLPTLLRASVLLNRPDIAELAEKQAAYFVSIQDDDGGFITLRSNRSKYFFDNAQILLGLCSLYNHNDTIIPKKAIDDLYLWLINNIDYSGKVNAVNFLDNNTPSYYSRCVWALLKYEKSFLKYHDARTIALLEHIRQMRLDSGAYQNWSFDGKSPALSHTVAYTLRGLYESAVILADQRLLHDVRDSVDALCHQLDEASRMQLPGEFYSNWSGTNTFVCSAGHAQFAVLCMRLYRDFNTKAYRSLAETWLSLLLGELRKPWHWHIRAVPSSIPFWAKYQPLRYTNWTQKFTCDAIMEIISSDS